MNSPSAVALLAHPRKLSRFPCSRGLQHIRSVRPIASERAAGASTTDTTRPRCAAPEAPRATRRRAVARPRADRNSIRCRTRRLLHRRVQPQRREPARRRRTRATPSPDRRRQPHGSNARAPSPDATSPTRNGPGSSPDSERASDGPLQARALQAMSENVHAVNIYPPVAVPSAAIPSRLRSDESRGAVGSEALTPVPIRPQPFDLRLSVSSAR